MAQSNTEEKYGTGVVALLSKNLTVATTASFATALTVDSKPIKDSTIIIHNQGAGDLNYQIIATAVDIESIVAPTGTNDDDKGWVTLASGSIATTIAPDVHTLSDSYTQVLVQIKHTTLTTNVHLWYRGETQ